MTKHQQPGPYSYPEMPDAELTDFATLTGIACRFLTVVLLLALTLGVWKLTHAYLLVHADTIKAHEKKAKMMELERSGP